MVASIRLNRSGRWIGVRLGFDPSGAATGGCLLAECKRQPSSRKTTEDLGIERMPLFGGGVQLALCGIGLSFRDGLFFTSRKYTSEYD